MHLPPPTFSSFCGSLQMPPKKIGIDFYGWGKSAREMVVWPLLFVWFLLVCTDWRWSTKDLVDLKWCIKHSRNIFTYQTGVQHSYSICVITPTILHITDNPWRQTNILINQVCVVCLLQQFFTHNSKFDPAQLEHFFKIDILSISCLLCFPLEKEGVFSLV